jgi:Peptidase family M50.
MLQIKALRLNISVFTVIAAAALLYADFSIYTVLALVSALIHEIGHYLAMRFLKTGIQEVSVYPFGIDIRINNTRLTYNEELAIALTGPAANVFAALFAYLLLVVHFSRPGLFFFFANLAFGFINMLPIKTLDGGKALECLLCAKLPLERALKIIEFVSAVFFIILTFFSLFVLAVTHYNFSLLIICAYLFLSVYVNEKY